MPGGGGDPYVEDIHGGWFRFKGEHTKRYTLYRDTEINVSGRVLNVPDDPEDRQFFSGFDVELSGGWRLVVLYDGKIHIIKDGDYHVTVESKHCTLDAPGHFGSTQDEPHPLMGIAHCNIDIPTFKPNMDATGLCVEGATSAEHPEQYEIPG